MNLSVGNVPITSNSVKNLPHCGYSSFMDSEWQHYKTAGEQAAAQRNFAAAEAMWAMAVLIAEYFGEQDPRLVFSLDNLGHALLREQKLKLAKQFLGRAWHLKTRVLGLPQKEVARTLNLIAEICFHEGKYSEAEPLSRWVLEVYESAYGSDDPRTVGAANNLSVLQKIVEQNAAAAGAQQLPAQDPQQAQMQQQQLQAQQQAQMQQQLQQQGQVAQMPPLQQVLDPAAQQQAQLQAQQQAQQRAQFEAQQQAHLQQQALLQQLAQQQQAQQQQQAVISKVPQRFKVQYCEVCGNKMEAEWCIRCTGTSLKPLGGPLDRLT